MDSKSISVVAEEPDDLMVLRRIINEGDRIVGSTTRVSKREGDHVRPDKGRRTRIRVALNVQKISLDNMLDRLRISGAISESESDAVPHGSHHSLVVSIGDPLTVTKDWSVAQKKLLHSSAQGTGFILVAIETSECCVARLRGTHLHSLPNIYSGSSGKRYKSSFNMGAFLDKAVMAVRSVMVPGDPVVIFGPGQTRKRMANHISKEEWDVRLADGIDSGGEDGMHIFTKSEAMRNIIKGSKMAEVSRIIEDVMQMAGKKSQKFVMGMQDARSAGKIGAIDSLVYSDEAVRKDESGMVDFLNEAASSGAKIFGVDSTTDAGLRVGGLGGIIAVLRFAIP